MMNNYTNIYDIDNIHFDNLPKIKVHYNKNKEIEK